MTGATAEVYWIRPDSVPERLRGDYLNVLGGDERDRLARFVFERDQGLYLAAHALLRFALSRHTGGSPSGWRFVTLPNGKPELAAGQEGPRFNLTHTRGLAACAIAVDGMLGLDAEHWRARPAPMEVATDVFTLAERDFLARLPPMAQSLAFFRLWTVKEAYAKAIGVGLGFPFDQLAVTLDPLTIAGIGPHWQLAEHRPTADHLLALAVGCHAAAITSVTWREFVPLVGDGPAVVTAVNSRPALGS